MAFKVFTTKSARQTSGLGERIARRVTSGTVLALSGPLGAGKTTFVQGLARGLGIRRRITSPTFIIVRTYKLNAKLFYHVDLYRMESQHELEGLGLKEILNDPNSIIAIEWAEKMGDMLPKKRWDVWFEYVGEEKRKIRIKKI